MKTDEKAASAPQPAEKMRYLSEIMVFQDLTPREMEDLNRITTMSTVLKGRVFYRPEEPGEVLFILKEGRVQLYRISPEGKKLVITTLGAHTLFGEMALLGTKLHNTFAEAVEDCLICVMSRNDLERLILSKPQVALRILEITGKRLREAEERLENMAFKGIPARLASLLLQFSDEQGQPRHRRADPSRPGRERRHLSGDGDPGAQRLEERWLYRNRAQAHHDFESGRAGRRGK